MMNKKEYKKTFIPYEKLLYVKFKEKIQEEEILTKCFEELGIKDDFSYKLLYFYEKEYTHAFLLKYQDILSDYDMLIPEPLLFSAYFMANKLEKNLVLIFKEKYIVLIEYNADLFCDCKSIPIGVFNKNFEEKLKNSYGNIISIDDVDNISSFKKLKSNDLYKKLLNNNDNFKINFSQKRNISFLKSCSFKFIISFILGVLLACIYPLYLFFEFSFIKNETLVLEQSLQEQVQIFKQIKQRQSQKENSIKQQDEIKNKIQNLKAFYANSLCYKDFFDFIGILNLHQSYIESLSINDNNFIIEVLKDYDFYDDFKQKQFILKNKEINNGKINLFFEKHI
ncbi:hypothetical protein IMC75_07230 [Campylobacter peloridis]|uniref:Uncharacterized protein n=2 Tax=Campylobacter peloridis TaxID=488546 RepID=A0ABX6TRX7_9BACT|nr:hypothetical protein [Campylobacter peloridis]AJC84654.1 hypothetical protein CPEL_0831 [Campylobacter peloridis LMG 23910]QOQ88722.1 hypothetical protein IMC75_07230 [Campylobacter peloridis]